MTSRKSELRDPLPCECGRAPTEMWDARRYRMGCLDCGLSVYARMREQALRGWNAMVTREKEAQG